MKKKLLQLVVGAFFILYHSNANAQLDYLSTVWNPDLGNGKYKNPIIYADYSDPDVCRVGEDYYMTASSFNTVPGLPILHSKDMISWKIINHAIQELRGEGIEPLDFFHKPQHGNGVWAPAIRYHNGEFYIYYGDPDFGIYVTKTKDPRGEWEPLTLVKAGQGLIDPCPFWDDDGNAYLAHAYAGSRARIKSLIAVTKLTSDGKKALGTSKIVYDGHDLDPTIEGPKFYKRNGYYYIFAPAGGVSTGWQTVLRSKNIYGPYERKIVLAQGSTTVNGPHQGAWVDTPNKEDWFFHFQDVGTLGRIVHLQPMIWKDDWPVIGDDKDGDGIGQPVLQHKKPNIVGANHKVNPIESDEFNDHILGLQWQWHANPKDWWHYLNPKDGLLTLFSVPVPTDYTNMWDIPNLLLQKIPAPNFTATIKLAFHPDEKIKGERTGLVIMGRDYSLISFENTEDGLVLSQIDCYGADRNKEEVTNESVSIQQRSLFLTLKVQDGEIGTFSYSLDGVDHINIGKSFKIKQGHWIGAKIGTFCMRPKMVNDGGRVDIDWFKVN